MDTQDDALLPMSDGVVAQLVSNHRQFLKFLEARVSSKAVAEELLQNAFVRAVEKGSSIEASESAVAWFYRLLRNALIDHYRRGATEVRAVEAHARETDEGFELELKDAVCACMKSLLPTLKPEYAEMIRRVDLEDAPLSEVASDLAITQNNATVRLHRLHRARQALKLRLERSCGTCASHGCLDCTCGQPGGGCA
jgi:RNA polymerase sigma factor (sigma-70 family)